MDRRSWRWSSSRASSKHTTLLPPNSRTGAGGLVGQGGLGERGLLGAVDAVLVARPPTSNFDVRPSPAERSARRAEQRDVAIDTVRRYNPNAVIVVGVPFGHTRPQWILPHGGTVIVDGDQQKLWADYS